VACQINDELASMPLAGTAFGFGLLIDVLTHNVLLM
jgi:hypothetical protein